MGVPQIGITTTHQKVHEGVFYTTNYLESAVADQGYTRLRVTTPANISAHITIGLDCEGLTLFKTYSGTTYTADGTLPEGTAVAKLTQFNRRGNGVSSVIVRYNPTINVLGVKRGNQIILGGTGPKTTGGTRGGTIESVIPANSDLLIELQNISGQPKYIGIVTDYYEVVR